MWHDVYNTLNTVYDNILQSNIYDEQSTLSLSSFYTICGYNKLKFTKNGEFIIRIEALLNMMNTVYDNIDIYSKNIVTINDNRGYLCASCLAALYAICIQLDRSNYIYLDIKPKLFNDLTKQDVQTGLYI